MEKKPRTAIKMKHLEEGDRFYFASDKNNVVEVFYKKTILVYGKYFVNAYKPVMDAPEKEVIFLRNVKPVEQQ